MKDVKSELRFLSDLLPSSEYKQVVYENDRYYTVICESLTHSRMDKWDMFCRVVQSRYEDKLIEIYSITSEGIHFEIYIRK